MNIFDAIGKTTFDVLRVTFGYAATWVRQNAAEVNAQVLYKAPTYKFDMNENDFTLERHTMEYYETDFPGLYDSVSDAGKEQIKIEVSTGVFETFVVKRCEKKGDGKTVIAILTPVTL
jgi:hypothetical protein